MSFPVMARAPRALFSVALALLASALFAVPASGSAQAVIRDCSEDGVLNGHYSHSELAKALAKLPSDIDEYTDCRAVIRSALLRSAKKNQGPGPGNVSPPNPNEQKRLHDAAKSAGAVNIGGKGITPGANGTPLKTAGFGTDLPPLVLAVLLALLGAMIGAAVLLVRRHQPALARVDASLGEPIRRLTNWARDGISRFRR
jgi:hypothetical protein